MNEIEKRELSKTKRGIGSLGDVLMEFEADVQRIFKKSDFSYSIERFPGINGSTSLYILEFSHKLRDEAIIISDKNPDICIQELLKRLIGLTSLEK